VNALLADNVVGSYGHRTMCILLKIQLVSNACTMFVLRIGMLRGLVSYNTLYVFELTGEQMLNVS